MEQEKEVSNLQSECIKSTQTPVHVSQQKTGLKTSTSDYDCDFAYYRYLLQHERQVVYEMGRGRV